MRRANVKQKIPGGQPPHREKAAGRAHFSSSIPGISSKKCCSPNGRNAEFDGQALSSRHHQGMHSVRLDTASMDIRS